MRHQIVAIALSWFPKLMVKYVYAWSQPDLIKYKLDLYSQALN